MASSVPSSHPTSHEQSSGQEIQPRCLVTRDQIQQISQNLKGCLVTQDQIQQISQNLKAQILKSIEDMKVMSKKGPSESHHAQLVLPLSSKSPEQMPIKRGKKRTTKVVGEFSLSYEVPRFCIDNNIDLDKSILYDDRSASDASKSRQFSFTERLQNWTLEQRKRISGTSDIFFNHMISGSSFRTKKELLNFLIYEKYPSKPNYKKDKKLQVVEASAGTNDESVGKEKQKACAEELDRERVDKFLNDSYDNLMNYDFGEPSGSEDEM
ncbi:hypothetical protein K1719_024256 [Acacia pycnantha]|nr:hypothetical protein K1719_024256 [Acacia pycnantha]